MEQQEVINWLHGESGRSDLPANYECLHNYGNSKWHFQVMEETAEYNF